MAEPLGGLAGAASRSPRLADIDRSAQARRLLLRGCGLPAAWAGQRQWRILATGFGLGLNFLAAWQAWREDPQRPGLLHFVAVETRPVSAADLLRGAEGSGGLLPLAQTLARQWRGLLPGTHRLSFEGCRVLLTLHIGDARHALRAERCIADAIFLEGFEAQADPAHGADDIIKAVGRCARRGATVAAPAIADETRRRLGSCGFQLEPFDALAPGLQALRGVYDPAWPVPGPAASAQPGEALVIGAGMAGAAVAASLARRGWSVRVLDAAPQPASGASGLPVGLYVPHQSPDDGPLSRLTRSGLRLTWEALQALERGRDWDDGGVLERDGRLPRDGAAHEGAWADWCRPASAQERAAGGLPEAEATWHAMAGWARPGPLVAHWMGQPGVSFRGSCKVRALHRADGGWEARGEDGLALDRAPLVVVAAALGSASLLPALPLQPVRGQVSWGPATPGMDLPGVVVNGHGHLAPAAWSAAGPAWYCGATFGRGESALDAREADHAANLQRLRELHPRAAEALAPSFAAGQARAWTGVRCASTDRRPLVGELQPGLWTSCAMGSRGLTFALLCAELLAARLHAEPLPLASRLAAALDLARLRLPRTET